MIAAVIVTFKDTEATHRCVTTLLAARPVPALIVLVDNGSPDGAADRHDAWVRGLGIPWRVVREGEVAEADRIWIAAQREPAIVLVRAAANHGFGGGVNRGWEVARLAPDLTAVLLLNNDATVDPAFLGPLAAALEDPQVGIATGTIHHDPAREEAWYAGGEFKWWQCRGSHGSTPGREPRDVTFCTGCLLLIRAAVLEAVGGMPELYFLYYEDVELCLRVRALGYRLRYVPASVVYHEVGVSTGHRTVAPRTAFVSSRNRLWVARRNLPPVRRLIAAVNIVADETGRLAGALWRGRPRVAAAIARGIAAGLFAPPTDTAAAAHTHWLQRQYAGTMTGA